MQRTTLPSDLSGARQAIYTSIRGRVGEVRAGVVANGIDGVWENVRQVDAEPSCLSVLWAAGRILMQREAGSA